MKILAALATLAFSAPLLHAQTDEHEDPWNRYDLPAATADELAQRDAISDRQYPFQRSLMREDIDIRIKKIRLDNGKRVSLVYGAPKKVRSLPAVFIMDVETSALAYHSNFPMQGLTKQRREELSQAGYLTRSPFGSNLLGNGFAIAYVVAEDLETLRSVRTADWTKIFDRVRGLSEVEDDSFFLFSTREYANSALYLAANYAFNGFILEEPTYLLFSKKTFESVVHRSDTLSSEEIWRRTDPNKQAVYLSTFSKITAPILLVRDRSSTAFAFNDKTLVPKLLEANAFVESVVLDGPTRQLETFGKAGGVMDVAPNISYDPRQLSLWLGEMIGYMNSNSRAEAIALRDPAALRRW